MRFKSLSQQIPRARLEPGPVWLYLTCYLLGLWIRIVQFNFIFLTNDNYRLTYKRLTELDLKGYKAGRYTTQFGYRSFKPMLHIHSHFYPERCKNLIKNLSLGTFGLILFFTSIQHAYAQPEEKLGNWVGANSSMRFNERWSLFLQGELRTWEMASNFNEMLWRIGGVYQINDKLSAAVGYVRVDTWPYDNEPYRKFYENRSYQDFVIKSKWVKGIAIQNRFRLEQRWLTFSNGDVEYSNRIRYLLSFNIPISQNKEKNTSNYIALFNEIFLDFDRFDYWFDREAGKSGLNQNRLYAGVGHRFSSSSALQVGMLWQHRPNSDFLRLVVWYTQNFDFRKK